MTYQCVLCRLRFSHRTVLEYHIREDHHRIPEPAPREPARAGGGLR
jgi:hypothetical protein